MSQLGAQKELRDPLQGDVLLGAPQGTQIWCLWTWRMLEVSANPPPLFPRNLSYPIPAGYGCPLSWSCFLSPFSFVPSFLIVALHFPLAAGLQRGVSQLATATYQGTTILLRRETLVLLDQGRAGSPPCHGQSPWWPLALLPGPRSRDTAGPVLVGCCLLHLTAPPNYSTSDL